MEINQSIKQSINRTAGSILNIDLWPHEKRYKSFHFKWSVLLKLMFIHKIVPYWFYKLSFLSSLLESSLTPANTTVLSKVVLAFLYTFLHIHVIQIWLHPICSVHIFSIMQRDMSWVSFQTNLNNQWFQHTLLGTK